MPSSLSIKDVCGRVDYGIITIREDEFNAVLDRLPTRLTVKGGKQLYEFDRIPVDGGGERGVAVVRCSGQGQGIAQSVAGHFIRSLQPRVLLLVGIAGGVPSDEFSLGDVLLASRLVDFSITAARQGGGSQLNVGGGPVHKIVEKLLAHLPALLHRMQNWNAPESIRHHAPAVTIPAGSKATAVYGSNEWKRKVIQTLRRHFDPAQPRRPPKAYVGPTASSNQLVKDDDVVRQWQEAARSIANIEMELAGVIQAARDAGEVEIPVIAIRGISDIVGFHRDPDWTGYACHSAASLCLAMIQSRVIEEASDWDWDAPTLMYSKVATVNEWLAGGAPTDTFSAAPPSNLPAPRADAMDNLEPTSSILILGPGGVGKTTLGAFLSGKEDRSPFAAPPAYNESVTVEQFALKAEGGPEAMILVPPGQPHRMVANWDQISKDLLEARFHGIIFLVAYGYHSVGQARWKELSLAKTLKTKTLRAFMKAYLERQREEELKVLRDLSPHIHACKTKLWLMTLVGKEDLWYPERENVLNHYVTGGYGDSIGEIERSKGIEKFKHELLPASLVINNFTSSVGEKLALNQAGYDRAHQVNSLRRVVEVLDSLRKWERGE